MEPMSWRFVVVTEAGAGGTPGGETLLRLDPGAPDGWLASVQPRLEIPVGSGGAARKVELEPRSLADLEPPALAPLLAAGGEPSAAELDSLLQHRLFQRLESAARGLEMLLQHTGGEIEVSLLTVSRKELVERFRETVYKPEMAADVNAPLGLILLDFDFTHAAQDLAALHELGGMALELQAPVVASTSPAFFDLRHLAHALALPDLASRFVDPAHVNWRVFQASEVARWVSLTVNRYLQRAPYDLQEPAYRETAQDARPETFLWGRGAWLVGAAAARSIRTHGHALDLSGRGGQFENLPLRLYPAKANESVPLSTEVPMPEEKAMEFSRAAFTPVVGRMHSNIAVLPIVVTCFRLSPGRLTVEGTLAYQLMAGRLAQFCSAMLSQLPSGDENSVKQFLTESLTGFLGSLAGEEPQKAVEVAIDPAEEQKPSTATVRVRPAVPLEGKQIDFTFVLPLRGR